MQPGLIVLFGVTGTVIFATIVFAIFKVVQVVRYRKRLMAAAGDIGEMRRQVKSQADKFNNEMAKIAAHALKKDILESCAELRNHGQVKTSKKMLAEWFRSKGYKVADPAPSILTNSLSSRAPYTITLPDVTPKELSDIMLS